MHGDGGSVRNVSIVAKPMAIGPSPIEYSGIGQRPARASPQSAAPLRQPQHMPCRIVPADGWRAIRRTPARVGGISADHNGFDTGLENGTPPPVVTDRRGGGAVPMRNPSAGLRCCACHESSTIQNAALTLSNVPTWMRPAYLRRRNPQQVASLPLLTSFRPICILHVTSTWRI